MNAHKIYLIIIAVLVIFILYMRSCAEPEIVTNTVTETIIERDTVVVRDTVYTEPIPTDEQEPVEGEGDSQVKDEEDIRLIRSSYSDPMIVIMANLKMDLLTGQVTDTRFTYTLKQRIVRDRQVQLNVNTTTTTRVTQTKQPRSYLSVGALAGPGEITPFATYTLSNQTMFLGGYNIQQEGWRVGVSVPLRSLF